MIFFGMGGGKPVLHLKAHNLKIICPNFPKFSPGQELSATPVLNLVRENFSAKFSDTSCHREREREMLIKDGEINLLVLKMLADYFLALIAKQHI